MAHKALIALAATILPVGALAADYVGTLRAPQSTLTPPGLYSFASPPVPPALATAYVEHRLKLGYKPSRYFAVEGEVVDFPRLEDPFRGPADLASQFRSPGFGVDTIAILPLKRFSLYGRMGAYRGDSRLGYHWHPMPLADGPATRSTRLRYGLGLRYDLTRSLGVRAELERNASLRDPLVSEIEPGDQVSVGLSWRF